MKFLLLCVLALPAVFGQFEPNVAGGRSVYVHLFEWKWTDIAAECERWLGPKGFGAIQISPPNEHAIITLPSRPWYERYQPVSYKLQSRSGNEAELQDMITRCNNAGVRIYVDAVINHMAAGGINTGTAGSSYNPGAESFPGVPFGPRDFTNKDECPTGSGGIENYGDAQQVRNCKLVGLPDLGIYKDYTRGKIQEYMNKLIDMGVAGFRIDAAKHMWPAHLDQLLRGLKNLNTRWFSAGTRPYIYHEVIDLGGEPITGREYISTGRVTEFKYGSELSKGVRRENGQMLSFFRNFGEGWNFLPGNRAVTFIDNHDNQRGHGAGGNILTFRDSRNYKIANAFMLAHPYGFPQVMSSYWWQPNWQNGKDENDWIGPPGNNGNTNNVPINPDNTCGGGWICEHRWRQIANMVGFRNTAGLGQLVHWWTNRGNQIAFGRGQTGQTTAFIAINNEYGLNMAEWLDTGLPAGIYCDVISGDFDSQTRACTGKQIEVYADRKAEFRILASDPDPIIAIHINAKIV